LYQAETVPQQMNIEPNTFQLPRRSWMTTGLLSLSPPLYWNNTNLVTDWHDEVEYHSFLAEHRYRRSCERICVFFRDAPYRTATVHTSQWLPNEALLPLWCPPGKSQDRYVPLREKMKGKELASIKDGIKEMSGDIKEMSGDKGWHQGHKGLKRPNSSCCALSIRSLYYEVK